MSVLKSYRTYDLFCRVPEFLYGGILSLPLRDDLPLRICNISNYFLSRAIKWIYHTQGLSISQSFGFKYCSVFWLPLLPGGEKFRCLLPFKVVRSLHCSLGREPQNKIPFIIALTILSENKIFYHLLYLEYVHCTVCGP